MQCWTSNSGNAKRKRVSHWCWSICMIRKEKWRIYSCAQLGREASNQSTLSQGHQLPSLWLASWVFVITSSIYGSTSAGKRNKQSGPQKKNPIYRACMGDRVEVKLLCLTDSPHLAFSLSLAQLPNSHLENNFWPRGVVSTPTLAFSWLKIFIGQIIC